MPTFQAFWRDLAKAADDLGLYGVGQSTITSVSLIGLLDSTTNASPDRYDGAWAYSPPDQRRVKRGGFTPSTGTITVELAWTSPTPGTSVAITRLFPVLEQVSGEDTSYRTIVNRALSMLLVKRRISFSATTADTYTTGALYPWLDREERIRKDEQGRWLVWESSPVSGRAPIPSAWRGWDLVRNGASTALQVRAPFSAPTGTVYLDVLAPGDTFINGAESTTGLSVDADTALPAVNDVTTVGLMLIAELLMARSPGRPPGTWAQRYPTLKANAEGLAMFDATQRRPAPAGDRAA